MIYLILFYGALIMIGGILLHSINSRAAKNSKKEKKNTDTPVGKKGFQDETAQVKKASGKETESLKTVMTDDEYRNVLRRSLKKQPGTKEKQEPVRDPDRYSDGQYREVLRSMQKQSHARKKSDSPFL